MPQETATVEPQGRRERKKAETRRAIRDAALERALELGVEHLTVTEITEAVDISPRTFFNYFSCKEDALVTDGAVNEGVAESESVRLTDVPAASATVHA